MLFYNILKKNKTIDFDMINKIVSRLQGRTLTNPYLHPWSLVI
jgi:hypothetical protein